MEAEALKPEGDNGADKARSIEVGAEMLLLGDDYGLRSTHQPIHWIHIYLYLSILSIYIIYLYYLSILSIYLSNYRSDDIIQR